jgi:hypothetical protein
VKPMPVLSVHVLLGANDEADYIVETLLAANTLARFLEQNGLLKRKVLDTHGEISRSEEITEDDLTDDGLALFWGLFIDKWMAAHDRGTKIENVKRLESALSRIRQVGAMNFLRSTRYFLYHTDRQAN